MLVLRRVSECWLMEKITVQQNMIALLRDTLLKIWKNNAGTSSHNFLHTFSSGYHTYRYLSTLRILEVQKSSLFILGHPKTSLAPWPSILRRSPITQNKSPRSEKSISNFQAMKMEATLIRHMRDPFLENHAGPGVPVWAWNRLPLTFVCKWEILLNKSLNYQRTSHYTASTKCLEAEVLRDTWLTWDRHRMAPGFCKRYLLVIGKLTIYQYINIIWESDQFSGSGINRTQQNDFFSLGQWQSKNHILVNFSYIEFKKMQKCKPWNCKYCGLLSSLFWQLTLPKIIHTHTHSKKKHI